MKVVYGRPPIYDEIVRVIGRPPVGAVYTWGDTIYAPVGAQLDPDLREHEAVHERQQAAMGGPEAWWQRYLESPQFRLEQEIEAYRKQYAFARFVGLGREMRRKLLAKLAKDLSGSMYGHLVRFRDAIELIR